MLEGHQQRRMCAMAKGSAELWTWSTPTADSAAAVFIHGSYRKSTVCVHHTAHFHQGKSRAELPLFCLITI